ncbi:MAG: ferritin family protein [Desulfotignum sp.]|nr:ferritin family protein [Desulfotignum sp.]MCF8086839.1 ferritin family protein [Desulfotignum sp.]MCF8136788.1 ferritin family protein [Desulfotignum sp.]
MTPSQDIFTTALVYEKKIRDLYRSAVETIDDPRGKELFQALADDEQSHVAFLEHGLTLLRDDKDQELEKPGTLIPFADRDFEKIKQMADQIPKHILGDLKRVLNAALSLEVETSRFYRDAIQKVDQGPVRDILEKFYDIEQRHVEVVQIELDFASNNGYWFNFMETDMED